MKSYKKHTLLSLLFLISFIGILVFSLVVVTMISSREETLYATLLFIPFILLAVIALLIDKKAVKNLKIKPRSLGLNIVALIFSIIIILYNLFYMFADDFVDNLYYNPLYKINGLIVFLLAFIYIVVKTILLIVENKKLKTSDDHIVEFQKIFLEEQAIAKEAYEKEAALEEFVAEHEFIPPHILEERRRKAEEEQRKKEEAERLRLEKERLAAEQHLNVPDHTTVHTPSSQPTYERSYFDGLTLERIGWKLLVGLVNILTLFLIYPITLTWIIRWQYRHRVYSGKRLVFKGLGTGLMARWLLWVLLFLVTFGIFGLFIPVRIERWKASNTYLVDDIKGMP